MFLKVFLRTLHKNGVHSVINILGMSVALLSCMCIYAIVTTELSTDKFNEKYDRIYRVVYDEREYGKYPLAGPPMGPYLEENYTQVAHQTRLKHSPNRVVTVGENQFYENRIFYADSSFFDVFAFDILEGDKASALTEPNSAVVSDAVARKYFGSASALGKSLVLDNTLQLTITAVMKTSGIRSHITPGILLPMRNFEVPPGLPVTMNDWGWVSFFTYVVLEPGADIGGLEESFRGLMTKHMPDDVGKGELRLQPMSEMYFGDVRHESTSSGNLLYTFSLVGSGILLLLLAVFNYTNISTALSLGRAREIGVRKSLGATKSQLHGSLSLESIMTALISFVVALAFFVPAISLLNGFLQLNLEPDLSVLPQLAAIFLLFAALTGWIASIYPSSVIAGFSPAAVLRGNFRSTLAGARIRKFLVALQFALTLSIIVVSLVINRQLDFVLRKDLGFDKDRIVVLNVPGDVLKKNFAGIRDVFLTNQNVENASAGASGLDYGYGSLNTVFEGKPESIPLTVDAVYPHYFETAGIQLVAGRELSQEIKSDTVDAFIINESCARMMDWSNEEALNKRVKLGPVRIGRIVGVVRDYHLTSLHNKIEPMIIYFPGGRITRFYIRLNDEKNMKDVVRSLQQTWAGLYPELPFDYSLLSDNIANLYRAEIQLESMISLFSYIAVVTACLGLYGMISLVIFQRMKDLCLRLVLGATPRELFWVLTAPFISLLAASAVIGFPVAYYYSSQWLQSFNYRTNLPVSIGLIAFSLVTGGLLLVVALKFRSVLRLNPTVVLRGS